MLVGDTGETLLRTRCLTTGAWSPRMPTPIIRATSLTKIVQSGDEPLTILDAVAFDVAAGATIAIVGASGSGKTTLLGLLAVLDRPTSGDVIIDGVALSTLDQD